MRFHLVWNACRYHFILRKVKGRNERDAIILASADDASEDFLAVHSSTAKSMLQKYHVGILQSSSVTKSTQVDHDNHRDVFLKRKHWSKAILKAKEKINNDTFHLIFHLEHGNQKLGVPIGKHLYLQCISSSGEKVIRSYTPISPVDQLGLFELIIKIYKDANDPSVGKMSACMERLREGDFVEYKGPFGDVEYLRNGVISIRGIVQQVEKLTMIAGGSGITPIYQVLRYVHADGIECDAS